MNPLVVIALLIAIGLVLMLPRRRVIIPWLLMAFVVPLGQVLVIGGVHFTVYRILVVVGLLRLAITRPPERRLAGGFSPIDWAFTLCSSILFITFCLQWLQGQAILKATGNLLDALGGYFFLRFLIRDAEDVRCAIKVMAGVAVVVGLCMINEQITRRNIFGLLGGSALYVPTRDGKTRSMGPFEVYITAGVFGATLLPLLIGLWNEKKSRLVVIAGFAGATAMTVTSNSSTPLLAYVAGLAAIGFWPIRRRMKAFRWLIVLTLIGLDIVMKAPVWALIQRIDLTGSSSGYQRFELVDQCIRHFSDWWLIGTKDYNKWGFDMWDLSDQYVANAVTGGLGAIVTFILVISRSFGKLGKARWRVRGNRKTEWYLWCIGAALFSHVVAYFGIGYFDQIQVSWYALLAMIGAVVANPLPLPTQSKATGDRSRVSTRAERQMARV